MSDFPSRYARLATFSTFDFDASGFDGSLKEQAILTSHAWPVANKAILTPITVRTLFLIRKFWWANGSAVAGNVDVGVYTMGGARLLSTGAIAQAGTSVIQSATPTAGPPWQLMPGSYYLALSASSASATFISTTSPAPREMQTSGFAEAVTANPLPDPITPATMVSNIIPLCGMSDAPVI